MSINSGMPKAMTSKISDISLQPKLTESNKQMSPNSTCSFLVDLADIQSMKLNLRDLLTSFRSGKLTAFGENDTIQQMENIRNMQGKLARLHFALDEEVEYDGLENSPTGLERHDHNMTTLLHDLEDISTTIKSLNPQPHSNVKIDQS